MPINFNYGRLNATFTIKAIDKTYYLFFDVVLRLDVTACER